MCDVEEELDDYFNYLILKFGEERIVFVIEFFLYFYFDKLDILRCFFIDQWKEWKELFFGKFYDLYCNLNVVDIDLENIVFFVIFLVLFLEMESDREIV